jgi:hypothetical protein
MTQVPSFINTGSGIQKSIEGIHTQIRRQQGGLISLRVFFKNKESRLIMQPFRHGPSKKETI